MQTDRMFWKGVDEDWQEILKPFVLVGLVLFSGMLCFDLQSTQTPFLDQKNNKYHSIHFLFAQTMKNKIFKYQKRTEKMQNSK